jgi:hypothetical protein
VRHEEGCGREAREQQEKAAQQRREGHAPGQAAYTARAQIMRQARAALSQEKKLPLAERRWLPASVKASDAVPECHQYRASKALAANRPHERRCRMMPCIYLASAAFKETCAECSDPGSDPESDSSGSDY